MYNHCLEHLTSKQYFRTQELPWLSYCHDHRCTRHKHLRVSYASFLLVHLRNLSKFLEPGDDLCNAAIVKKTYQTNCLSLQWPCTLKQSPNFSFFEGRGVGVDEAKFCKFPKTLLTIHSKLQDHKMFLQFCHFLISLFTPIKIFLFFAANNNKLAYWHYI